MKQFLLLFILLFSLNVLSQSDRGDGGQNGSGGNGCYITNEHGTIWRALDDISINSDPSGQWPVWQQIDALPYRSEESSTFNFSNFRSLKYANAKFQNLSYVLPRTSKILMELSTFFEHVNVQRYRIKGIYEGDVNNNHHRCKSFYPAVLTYFDGTVLVPRPIWNSIGMNIKELVVLHEILRFAQMFHPSFKDFSNEEIQEVTKLLINEAPKSQISKHLNRFERRLAAPQYYSLNKIPKFYSEFQLADKFHDCDLRNIKLKSCLDEYFIEKSFE